jgi:hypothetical protein
LTAYIAPLIVITASSLLKLWDIVQAGWALGAGVAGGADVILIPEIPYDVKQSCRIHP